MIDRRPFFDTNVLIYAIAKEDPRAWTAEALLFRGGFIGVQTLNEFVAVAMRKLHMAWEEIREALHMFRILCPSPVPVTLETHERALRIAAAYQESVRRSGVRQPFALLPAFVAEA
jgi:predicted nucleic acid-binding protein